MTPRRCHARGTARKHLQTCRAGLQDFGIPFRASLRSPGAAAVTSSAAAAIVTIPQEQRP